ncbi:hypothetical protein FLJC2902T_14410 [Flavobacterium limnosediminis JC2902]|uniref:Uncharacterized protein n=1 Tax=Flavobacterium limnosediminis JC2902 TaxID=1341181 RepID=V6SQW6_9FLAO|nr:hypothetical protein FLJC2902T_14410 [Flavobacterium limnosediminis JC2902]
MFSELQKNCIATYNIEQEELCYILSKKTLFQLFIFTVPLHFNCLKNNLLQNLPSAVKN